MKSENSADVPLIQRAYDFWEILESEGGGRLLLPTGGVMIGPEGGAPLDRLAPPRDQLPVAIRVPWMV